MDRSRWIAGGAAFLAAAVWATWYVRARSAETRIAEDAAGALRVVFLDVGYGDAAWITTPNGTHLLIDAGPGADGALTQHGQRMVFSTQNVVFALGDHLAGAGVRQLEAVMITHPHYDHWGGLRELLNENRVTVKRVYELEGSAVDRSYEDLHRMLEEREIERIGLSAGDAVPVPDPSVRLEALGPSAERGTAGAGLSLLLKLTHGDFAVLFAGDAGPEEELDALEMGDRLSATVLKAADHGHRLSTTAPFLDAVSPRLAVVSVEEPNVFGLPHDDTLQKFIDRDIDYYRTDIDGNVTVLSDGRGWTVETER